MIPIADDDGVGRAFEPVENGRHRSMRIHDRIICDRGHNLSDEAPAPVASRHFPDTLECNHPYYASGILNAKRVVVVA
jgi:hypothetical protein